MKNETWYQCKIKLTEDMLGTKPKISNIYEEYVASKAEEYTKITEEIAGLPTEPDTIEARGWTTFLKDENGYYILDYMIHGFLKEAARAIKQLGTVKQLQDKIRRFTAVYPRKIYVPDPEPQPFERPVRASTPQGMRTFLSRSDYVKAGAELEFQLRVMEQSSLNKEMLKEIFAYSELYGLGQFRSGSYGRFKLKVFKEIKTPKEEDCEE